MFRTLTIAAALALLPFLLPSAARAEHWMQDMPDYSAGSCNSPATTVEKFIHDCEQDIKFGKLGPEKMSMALLSLGDGLRLLGQYDDALNVYQKSVDVNPRNTIARFRHGELLEDTGRYELALADFDALLDQDRTDDVTFAERCWLKALMGGTQLPSAVADCDAAIAKTPNSANRLDSRAFVYFRLGNYPAAIKDADAALAINPKLANSLYVRGLAKRKSGDAAGGQADIDLALTLKPTIVDTYAGYGVTR